MKSTTKGNEMISISECLEARLWDSEKRNSPYSTVADVMGMEDYCEGCDSTVDYSNGSKHGTCGCE
jgi:hypothetical protein